jgi:hypothetical protein
VYSSKNEQDAKLEKNHVEKKNNFGDQRKSYGLKNEYQPEESGSMGLTVFIVDSIKKSVGMK